MDTHAGAAQNGAGSESRPFLHLRGVYVWTGIPNADVGGERGMLVRPISLRKIFEDGSVHPYSTMGECLVPISDVLNATETLTTASRHFIIL